MLTCFWSLDQYPLVLSKFQKMQANFGYLVIRSIKPPFGFELISENVSKILGIKRIQTITWLAIDMSNLLFETIPLKIPIPGDDLQ